MPSIGKGWKPQAGRHDQMAAYKGRCVDEDVPCRGGFATFCEAGTSFSDTPPEGELNDDSDGGLLPRAADL